MMTVDLQLIKVIVDAPLGEPLDYLVDPSFNLVVGERCVVPLGRRKVIGLVVALSETAKVSPEKLKKVIARVDNISPLDANWLALTSFSADYYLSTWGQAAISSLPKFFRKLPGKLHEISLERIRRTPKKASDSVMVSHQLTKEQTKVFQRLNQKTSFTVSLLFGVTGSGKTEIYLQLIHSLLSREPQAQALVLVPEINLTPQLEQRVRNRFPKERVVTLHSALAEGDKARSWLAAHEKKARIIVGTRLAVFSSIPNLRLIVVDEEHDASYKSGEGLRYSARDLAIKRAQLCNCPVLLGSATPSLESIHKVFSGAYEMLTLGKRANETAQLPTLHIVDTKKDPEINGLSQETRLSISETLARGEQVLVFLNRRGYAPVVMCNGCGWVSVCPHCSTYAVFHKTTQRLICHHCGWSAPLPKNCPKCGSFELVALGRGTQRIEEELAHSWPQARILRIDQDSTRRRGQAEAAFDKVHLGEVDILLGTQMVAKGHDFQRVSLVVVLNVDSQLISSDFRARERLFSMLMQVSGRAGRGKLTGQVLLQTKHPQEKLFDFLAQQDFLGFAQEELKARQQSFMPPYTSQALIIAEGKDIDSVLAFLGRAKLYAESFNFSNVRIYDPVPLHIVRIADIERGQLLIEADSKKELQKFLSEWTKAMRKVKTKFNWFVEVDPQLL